MLNFDRKLSKFSINLAFNLVLGQGLYTRGYLERPWLNVFVGLRHKFHVAWYLPQKWPGRVNCHQSSERFNFHATKPLTGTIRLTVSGWTALKLEKAILYLFSIFILVLPSIQEYLQLHCGFISARIALEEFRSMGRI